MKFYEYDKPKPNLNVEEYLNYVIKNEYILK